MSMYDDMFLENANDNETSVEEYCIDPSDELSILEAMADMEIEEKACAAKKEACKKEEANCKKGVCEKCGKPKSECTCGK